MKQQILLYLVTFFFLVGCSTDDDTGTIDNIQINPIDTKEPINYLALGDSYTIGQGVEIVERWPNQLVQKLRLNEIRVDRLDIIAQTGWRTNNLINAIEANNPQNFNLVSLLIGVNNQFSNINFDVFMVEFDELIQQSIQIAGNNNRVFVVSIPDYGVTPFGSSWGNPEQIASELDLYNNYMKERCAELDIPFIDITDISRSLENTVGALSDGLHPSGMQYQLWVEEILPVVLGMVND